MRLASVIGPVAACSLVLLSRGARAAPEWTVQVDPLTVALGFVHLQIERAVAPHWSIYAGPSLHLYGGLLAEEDDVDFIGIGLEAGVRYYFEPAAPQGAWLLLRGVLAHLTTDGPPSDSKLGGYVSALVGYTFIFDGTWVLAGGLGVQYMSYQIANAGPKGVLPAAHTAFGIAF